MIHCATHKIEYGYEPCPMCKQDGSICEVDSVEVSTMKTVNETLDERAQTHGDFEEYAEIVSAFRYITRNSKLTNAQTAGLDMIFSKIARIVNGNPNEADHWRDIAGYATLVERSINNG